MVVAAQAPTGWTVSWVGDCRAFLVRPRGVTLLTRDHTVAQAFRDEGLPVNPAWDNLVTTTVAHAAPDLVGHVGVPAGPGTLVLVSDGVHRRLDAETLAFVVRRAASPAAAARTLVGAALAAGTTDNATAAVLPL